MATYHDLVDQIFRSMNLPNYQRINLLFYLFSWQVIILSASANKLAKLKGHAATYASLIMEELDPDDRGYIEVVLVQKQHLLSVQQG